MPLHLYYYFLLFYNISCLECRGRFLFFYIKLPQPRTELEKVQSLKTKILNLIICRGLKVPTWSYLHYPHLILVPMYSVGLINCSANKTKLEHISYGF